ncbi:hypothetical protein D3C75_399410 [compost metagenome]
MAEQRLVDAIPAQFGVQERFGTFCQLRQNRLQIGHQHAEQVDTHGADSLQVGIAAFLFRHHPRCLLVNVAVGQIGQRHDFADGFAELAAFPRIADGLCCVDKGLVQGRIRQLSGHHTVETLGDKARITRGKVDHFVDDIRVHALNEIFQIQVDIVDAGRELRRVVVAQAVGVKMVQPGAGLNERPARFGHLRAVDRHVAVDEQVGRLAEVAAFQHRWPEQAVEVDDVLADKVIQLGGGVFLPVLFKADGVAALVAQVLERTHVADWRIQPDVEIFARRVRDFEAEVRCIAGDIPLLQAGFKPLLHFVRHLLLQRAAAGPRLQHRAERRQVEEEVFGITHFRRRAGDHGLWLNQLSRAVGRAAHFAVISILIRCLTFRAGAFHKTVRQEHAFFRIVELRDGAVFDKTVLFQAGVDQLR